MQEVRDKNHLEGKFDLSNQRGTFKIILPLLLNEFFEVKNVRKVEIKLVLLEGTQELLIGLVGFDITKYKSGFVFQRPADKNGMSEPSEPIIVVNGNESYTSLAYRTFNQESIQIPWIYEVNIFPDKLVVEVNTYQNYPLLLGITIDIE